LHDAEDPRADRPALGIGMMLLALFLLSAMDAISKHLTETLAVPQILAIRFWFFLLFAMALASSNGIARTVRSAAPGLQLLRSLVMLGQMSSFIFAVSYLPLADVGAIFAVAPLLVMVLSAVFLGEKIGPRRAAAVTFGFIGVLIIIRPGTGVFDPISLIALGGASCWAVFQILLRVVGRRDSVETTTLFSAVIGCAAFSMVAPFVWRAPGPMTWIWLLVLGALGAIGHYLLSAAFRHAPASTLQPFAYTMPVWAVVMGWIVFHDIPDLWTFIGGGTVIASGLYALRRERVAVQT
jgi:drug/metabolite transporter (DMT)-like permease